MRLTADGAETLLTLEHTVPQGAGRQRSPGALYVGPGWDGALLALALYLDGMVAEDPVAAANSPEAQEFCAESIDAWVGSSRPRGARRRSRSPARREVALAQFAPDLVG